jgi:hypothetical protein
MVKIYIFIFVKNECMAGKYLDKGIPSIKILFKIDKEVYESMIKLKISRGYDGSLTKWLNKMLAEVALANENEIKGYSIDENSDF